MSIKRFYANKDNTITNAFKGDLVTRAEASNTGESDIVELFSIYAQATTSSVEKSRILLDFPIEQISQARTNGQIPASGSVKFKLKLFNARHSQTLPKNFTVSINALSSPWTEGEGLDMEGYSDLDASNWLSASINTAWNEPGGDILTVPGNIYTQTHTFSKGTEDLDVDISSTVEAWLANTIDNYGLIIKLDGSFEDGSLEKSYYTKKFFARGSQYFFKRPIIEAQFDDSSTVELPENYSQSDEYVTNITNLKSTYSPYESTTFKIYTRKKDWQPNIYTVATNEAPVDIIDDLYYKIVRVSDNFEIINYSTGSTPHYSKASYNASGSYFDFDMSLLEPEYSYEISLLRKNNNKFIEQQEKFRFRVKK